MVATNLRKSVHLKKQRNSNYSESTCCNSSTCSPSNSLTSLDKLEFRDHPTPEQVQQKAEKFSAKKYRSRELAQNLFALSQKNNSPLQKQYLNTIGCCNVLVEQNGKFTARCCRNRWCFVCSGKRTRLLIESYAEQLKPHIGNLYFVTLTKKNVKGNQLRNTIKSDHSTISKIVRGQTRKGNRISLIRTTETTHNSKRNDFHPHYHLLVIGKENAKYIRESWIQRHGNPKIVCPHQQTNIKFGLRPEPFENQLIEVFKYTTKLDVDKIESIKALDTIFVATKGIQMIQTYGDIKKAVEDKTEKIEVPSITSNEFAYWLWNHSVKDWVCMLDGLMYARKQYLQTALIPPN